MKGLLQAPKIGLSPERRREIRGRATALLKQIEYREGPVSIDQVAKTLGATVKYAPFDGELAGMLIQSGDLKVIAVNSSHHKNRQRFTIAHECGHLLLHTRSTYVDRNFTIKNRDEESSKASSHEEIEANQFAADILMPYRNVLFDLARYNIDIEDSDSVSKMAKSYGVSLQAMSYRIANLIAV